MRTGVRAQRQSGTAGGSHLAAPNGRSAGMHGVAAPTEGIAVRRMSPPVANEPVVVPAVVRDVVRSAGQPLDPGTRALMEPRFGHDFTQVRVHADATAAESARILRADAYTVGRDIVFGAGQFSPDTPRGRRLLSHELTHVVQQRHASGPIAPSVGAAGGSHERQAAAVADAVMRGGDVAGLLASDTGTGRPTLQRQPAAPPRPLDYDREPVELQLLDPKTTASQLQAALDAKVKAGELTSYSVRGAKAGSHEEIFLLGAVYRLGKRNRWGTEIDIVTPIDWPARAGAATPRARVTVRIDALGVASAELIAAGPVPAMTSMTAAAATAALTADFGFASVSGWTGTNVQKDAAELSDVVAALTLLKARAPQDVAALAGVELIRVPSLGGDTAGEFSLGGPAAGGAASGKPFLKLTDRAFQGGDIQFFGGGPGAPTQPASFQVILHEVGHAVEKEDLRGARAGVMKATAELEALKTQAAAKAAAYDARFAAAKRAGKLGAFYKKEEAEYKKAHAEEDKARDRITAADARVAQTKVGPAAIAPIAASAAALATSAADLLRDARAHVQTLQGADAQAAAPYLQAVERAGTAVATFASSARAGTGAVGDLVTVAAQAAADRDRVYLSLRRTPAPGTPTRAVEPLVRTAEAQDLWLDAEYVLANARQRTLRLQRFIDLVATNNIRRFTKYSVDNWKLIPDEFYAEAYSLWLVDPAFLQTNYKPVYDFFQNGDYRR